jgi:hypothetical protein
MRNRITINEFAAAAKELLGTVEITYAQAKSVQDIYNVCIPGSFDAKENRVSRGVYKIPATDEVVTTPLKVSANSNESSSEEQNSVVTRVATTGAMALDASISFIPRMDNTYVPWGNSNDIKKVIKSKMFFPVYLTGMSGNGKTFGIEQTCAALGREMIRVNFTAETDEDDLFGGFRLVNGETVFQYGPVIEAMKRGAVLLLDEIDLASSKVMALQSVLEGKGYFIKKRGEWVEPSKGFTVIATANTKGKGSDDGRFVGTNVLNEAFLDRFSITLYQAYPSETIEKKILQKAAEGFGLRSAEVDAFIPNLTMWGDIIRKTFEDGGIDDIISTRRLVDILKSYSIFGNKGKAIKMSIERFDDETKESFMSLYEKIDAGVGENEKYGTAVTSDETSEAAS